MKITILGLLLVLSVYADPIAVTWSGSPDIISADCPACFYGFSPQATETQNGPNADLNIGYGTQAQAIGAFSNSILEGQFTLASDALIALSANVAYSSSGDSCGDLSCASLTFWNYSGSVADDIEVLSAGNVVLDLPLSDSGSVVTNCDPVQGCTANLSLSANGEITGELAAGTYTILIKQSDRNSSVGDSWSYEGLGASLSDPPVPTPEARYVGLISILMLFAFLLRRFSRRSSKI